MDKELEEEEVEEEFTDEDIASLSLMMQKAFGQDRGAAGQINAWIDALKSEAPIPTIPAGEEMPDIAPFGVPTEVFVRREDAWQNMVAIAEEVRNYPGADIGGKNFIKSVFLRGEGEDEINYNSKIDTWWETEGFVDYLKERTDDRDITAFIDAMLDTSKEVEVGEERYGEPRTLAEVAPAAATKVTAEVPFGIPTTEISEGKEGIPKVLQVTVPYLFRTAEGMIETQTVSGEKAYFGKEIIEEKREELRNQANIYDLANRDIDQAIEGVIDTYVPQARQETKGGTYEEMFLGTWKQRAKRELDQSGTRTAKSGDTKGFVVSSPSIVAEFYDITNSVSQLTMNNYKQLDLLRSIPREYSFQESVDLSAKVFHWTAGARPNWVAEVAMETKVNPLDYVDQAIAVSSKQEMTKTEATQHKGGVEERLGLTRERPSYLTTGYQAGMSEAVTWHLKRLLGEAFFPDEKQYVTASKAVTGERTGVFSSIPLSERKKGATYKPAMDALFPPAYWSGAPKRKKGEEEETEEEKAQRLRKGAFPSLVYRVPEW